MALLDRVLARAAAGRAWPVGDGAIGFVDTRRGHNDDRFSPEEYGDYLATSNDVFSVVNLRAKKMGSLQPLLFDTDGPERELITDGPVWERFHQPNPFWTFERLNRTDSLCLDLWGESFWALQYGPGNIPAEFWWMKPTRVTVVPDASGYVSGFLYHPVDGGEPIPFRPDEVFWQRMPNPLDEFSPMAPLAAARQAADTAKAMNRSNKALFENGMQAGGIIAPKDGVTYTEDQATSLRAKLEERLKGVDNAHRWAVLRFDAQVKELTVTPKDAEFVAGLNMTLRQVCRVYGVPSPLMMDLEHATLANVKEFDRMLWDHGLVDDANFRAADVRLQVLPRFPGVPTHMEWDYSKVPVLQESVTSVWERERGQIETGATVINEWRMAKGLPPVPWGDVWWAPVNKAQVADEATTAPAANGDPAPVNADPGGATDRALARLLDAVPVPAVNGHHHRGA